MANWYAQSSSANINATNLWNSAANGSGSYLTWPPSSGDYLYANDKTGIVINVDFNIGSGYLRNDNGSYTGGFVVTSTRTVTANVKGGYDTCINVQSGGNLTLTGNVTGPEWSASATVGGIVLSASNSTVSVTGNVTGGNYNSNCPGIYISGATTSGSLSVAGNVTGGGVNGTNSGIYSITNCPITITGGGTITSGAYGGKGIYIVNNANGLVVSVTANITGGSGQGGLGISSPSYTCTLTVTGNVTGGSNSGSRGIDVTGNPGKVTVSVTGTVTAGGGSTAMVGQTAAITINGSIINVSGMEALSCDNPIINLSSSQYRRIWNGSSNVNLYPTAAAAATKYVYSGINNGNGSTGILNISNIADAKGSGSNLSAGILKKDSVVDDVTGTYQPTGGGMGSISGSIVNG